MTITSQYAFRLGSWSSWLGFLVLDNTVFLILLCILHCSWNGDWIQQKTNKAAKPVFLGLENVPALYISSLGATAEVKSSVAMATIWYVLCGNAYLLQNLLLNSDVDMNKCW